MKVVQTGGSVRKLASPGRRDELVHEDWTPPELRALRKGLLSWSKRNHREMPWRGVADPYRVWVSEIMLQQTTVAAVIPYYERFLKRFPDVKSLAAADVQDVLTAWEGLGYYSRGRNMHRAAQAVVTDHAGEFPKSVEGLRALPGIGRYTAGAIASFAFDRRAPILEANTMRVYARLLGFGDDPRTSEGQAALWEFAETILPASGVGAFNQALIDLGAMVCTPAAPKCEDCPLAGVCRAFRAGRQLEIPPPKTRPVVTEVHEAAVAIRCEDRWLVRQRETGERWAGMWDFLRLPLKDVLNSSSSGIVARLFDEKGIRTTLVTVLSPFSHSVTRYRIRLARVVVEFESGERTVEFEHRWVTMDELRALPMPMAARRFVEELRRPGWDPGESFKLRSTPGRTGKRAKRG